MISVPVKLMRHLVSAVFPGVAAVVPDTSYWVAANEDGNITVTGTPVITCTGNIKAGWNMIGSVFNGASIPDSTDNPDSSVQPSAYWWAPATKCYIVTTTMEPGRG